ncbi:ABC transporter permease [Amycolatopsis pigmentata]|uniref:Transport permease protein n=1 Tax=Amycolatopsis pigmentata TaxID=450801 RepID=A0ABW5FTN3_9PSEU
MTTAVLEPPRHISASLAVRHGLALAGRGILKIRKNPSQLLDVTLQPILFMIMFVYLFGGAIAGGTGAYLQQLTPGLMVQNIVMASMAAGVALNTDVSKGVFDRFRSMPIARSAPLVGAVLADIVRYLVALGTLVVTAMIMGFRVQTGPLPLLAALALMVLTGLCFCWAPVFVGMLMRSPVAVQGTMIAFIMPLTFGSNVFVPASTLPGWLQAWVHVNPVSLLTEVTRGLLNGGPVLGPLLGGLAWLAGFVVVFFPLAMRAYRHRVS